MTGLPPSRCRRPSRYCSCRSLFCGLCSSLTNSLPHDLGEGCCHIERAAGVQVDNTLTQAHKNTQHSVASSINVPSAGGAGGFPERGKTHPERGYLGGSNARDVSGGAALYRNEIANPDQVQHHDIRQFASHLLFDVAQPTCATVLHSSSSCFCTLSYTSQIIAALTRWAAARMFAGSQASAIARAGALLRRTMQASEGLVVLSDTPPVISSHSLSCSFPQCGICALYLATAL